MALNSTYLKGMIISFMTLLSEHQWNTGQASTHDDVFTHVKIHWINKIIVSSQCEDSIVQIVANAKYEI